MNKNVRIDVKQSVKDSLEEAKDMREGKTSKLDWREMLDEVEKEIKGESE